MGEKGRKIILQEDEIQYLSNLNEVLENYFKSAIIPQLFFDRDLILRKYSPAAMKQFNLRKGDAGKHLHDISNNIKYNSLEEDLLATMSSQRPLEKEIQTTDEKWYRMNVLPYIERKTNTTNGVILTFIDINNYVLALKELQNVNSEHELFIYSVSHDLKAPLHNIEGLTDVLQEAVRKGDVTESENIMKMLKASVEKMKQMIVDLAKTSKLQSEPSEKIGFQEMLDEVILTLKGNIDKTHARIIADFQIAGSNISRKHLRSIFYNLISNAIKYQAMDREPEIHVKSQKSENYILLSVRDNGIGIPEDKKELIFSRFERGHSDIEGTGVGLYLVSKIVDARGGKIVINTKLEQGSEFQIYLKS